MKLTNITQALRLIQYSIPVLYYFCWFDTFQMVMHFKELFAFVLKLNMLPLVGFIPSHFTYSPLMLNQSLVVGHRPILPSLPLCLLVFFMVINMPQNEQSLLLYFLVFVFQLVARQGIKNLSH